jgi:chorismate mutase / prephenate dehydratase
VAKHRGPKDSKAGASKQLSPADARAQLDRLDRELVVLLNQLATLAAHVAQSPKADGQPALSFACEDDQIARAVAQNKGPLSDDCVRGILRELASGTRWLRRQLRVSFLGPDYTYSHLAALHRFGQSIAQVPVGSISAVFEEVDRRQADFGLVPIENSTDGRIADTLDMFNRLRVRICGEVQLRIRHSLLARCPRAEVKEVYSRPQALSQCRNWLARHLPSARPIEVTSTATAAQLALDKPGAAAIASVQAGIHYGLDVLADNIEDNPGNTTRFAVIGHESAPRSGRDKTAAMFEIEHRPGSLADVVAIFKRNRLNLTWIESFPSARPAEYLFFIEFDGHETDLRVRRALATLAKKTQRMEVLGSFPRSEPVG